ncbi:hypothetical protein [Streptomyces scopuliridis]|uniref:hypothetical protein n=1 Tax=Streptomyces scopuliridis TaxID=452529 RepID=UPI0035E37538
MNDITKQMPNVPALLDRCRGLAMIQRIIETLEPGDWGYTFERTECAYGTDWTLHMERQEQNFTVHFHGADVLVYGWDTNDEFTFLDELCDFGPPEVWPAILSQIPAELRACLPADDEDSTLLSVVTWRLATDSRWHAGDFPLPLDEDKAEALRNSWGWSADLLVDLIHPSPSNLEWCGSLRDGTYRDDPEIEWGDTGISFEGALRHILALKPLTEEVVRTLNPSRGLVDVADDITAIEYPQDAPAG